MADVTVNIRGNASQLRNELENVSKTTDSASSGYNSGKIGRDESGSARMIEDVRREMQQRGVVLVPGSSSMSQIINQYSQAQKDSVEATISDRYDSRRADMRGRMSDDYDNIESDIERKRQEGLQRLGGSASDPLARQLLENKLEQDRESQYRKVGLKYDQEEEQIDQEESEERGKSERELTQAIKELTDYFTRQAEQNGHQPDSYISQLRERQKSLIEERDSALTEEEARDASKRLASVNEEMRGVMSGQGKTNKLLSGMQIGGGALATVNSLQNGDVSGSLMGAALMTGNPYVIAGGAALSAITGMANMGMSVSESYSPLAAFRSTAGGRELKDARQHLTYMGSRMSVNGINYSDLGMDQEDFAAEAFKRTSSRRIGGDWFEETMRQIGLEKTFALSDGALGQAGRYDRYGQNSTDAISKLVTTLSAITNSGVSQGDFTKVQEKFDIQQQLMGSYLGRSDKPSYDVANRTLAAFSGTEGITQDSRMGGEIQQFQNMIQNPMNERMKALVYGTVSDLFPETGGSIAEIDKAIENPENEGKIMSSVVKKLASMYGDTDSDMGHFVFKQLLPGMSSDRRDAYIKSILEGGTGEMLEGENAEFNGVINSLNKQGINNRDAFMKQAEGGVAEGNKLMKELVDSVKGISTWLTSSGKKPGDNGIHTQ